MSTTNNTKSAMPALIVFGTPKGAKAPRHDGLLATWWERVLAGVAVAFLMTLLADVVARG